jgi:hypothetical protein
MSDLSRGERLQIMLSPEEIRALDDWRFAYRMPSRAAAIREILRRGLAVEGIDLATDGKHSTHFGVLGEAPSKRNGKGSKARGSRIGDGPP